MTTFFWKKFGKIHKLWNLESRSLI